MNIRSLFSNLIVTLSLRELLESFRRLLFPQPVRVRVSKATANDRRSMRGPPVVGLLLITLLLGSSCAKKDDAASSSTTGGAASQSAQAKTSTGTAAKTGGSPGGASPLGQQMVAQKLVEDISGGTDIRAGRRAADKIREVSSDHNADLDEIK